MNDVLFTCPRCLRPLPAGVEVQFCPHCGLAGARDAAIADARGAPADVSGASRTYRVLDRIAVGSVSSVYRCRFTDADKPVEGTFKIARDGLATPLIDNEAAVLRHLYDRDSVGRYRPFFPTLVESIEIPGDSPRATARRGNVLRLHDSIASPADELYTLDEVRAQYPTGLDPRHMAWIWRRVLSVVGYAHASGVIHGAVLPMHILIEPREHKLILIDWCCAVREPWATKALTILTGGEHATWYRREYAQAHPPSPALDIALAARSMTALLGGDPLGLDAFPHNVDAALRRYFQRCINGAGGAGAWKLLEDFDRLIEVLWGARRFCMLEMQAKGAPAS